MNDTASGPELGSAELMDDPGVERFIKGCRMFDEFRAQIIAWLPNDLPDAELRRQVFERTYGASMEDFLSGKVTDTDLQK